jgi:hypothetical protein
MLELLKVLKLSAKGAIALAIILWHSVAYSPVASSVEGDRAERGSVEA